MGATYQCGAKVEDALKSNEPCLSPAIKIRASEGRSGYSPVGMYGHSHSFVVIVVKQKGNL